MADEDNRSSKRFREDFSPPTHQFQDQNRASTNASPLLLFSHRMLNRLNDRLAQLIETQPEPVLRYRDVVAYLATHQPPTSRPRGALLRARHGTAWDFHLFYIDEHGKPITDQQTGRNIGKVVMARTCDEELRDMFGRNDLILFD